MERGEDLAAEATSDAAARTAPRTCPCGVVDVAPWRGHELPWSPASVIAGTLILAFAVAAIVVEKVWWVGPAVVAVWLLATVGTFVLAGRRGHRGTCLARRGTWMGVAAIGVPLRIAASLPF